MYPADPTRLGSSYIKSRTAADGEKGQDKRAVDGDCRPVH
jgi:hypothetical protein